MWLASVSSDQFLQELVWHECQTIIHIADAIDVHIKQSIYVRGTFRIVIMTGYDYWLKMHDV